MMIAGLVFRANGMVESGLWQMCSMHIVTKRSYKNSFSVDDAFTQLEKESGSQFEPLIVELFVNQKEVVKQLYRDIT